MYAVYGIPNCNSVQKARLWLDKHNISYTFHDYKTAGISKAKLNSWCKQYGWENLLNKNSTTWRELSEDARASITSQAAAVAVMLEHNTIIKRPLIELDNKIVMLRFDEAAYQNTFL
jgi:arsenate reductase (glutaredoxin)